jgi:hypothetical protein
MRLVILCTTLCGTAFPILFLPTIASPFYFQPSFFFIRKNYGPKINETQTRLDEHFTGQNEKWMKCL